MEHIHHQTYPVRGMHCASCAATISKRLKKLPGVTECEVSFATEKATVTFDPDQVSVASMNHHIGPLGYSLEDHAHMDHSEHLGLNQSKEAKLKELDAIRGTVEFIMPVTLTVFFLMLWDIAAKLLDWVPNLPIPMPLFNLISFLLASIALFWVGRPFLKGVGTFIAHRAANMDTLIGIGTLTAYLYSSLVFLFPAIAELIKAPEYTYFDVTIVVIGFVTLGKYLEARSKLKTGEAIEKLLQLQAKTALVIRDGQEIEVPISEVQVGEIIRVKPGAKIPVDGTILEGSSAIDESMITGEPIPVDRHPGEPVIGSTINKQGSFTFTATKVGSETMLAQIVAMVEQAQGSKTKIQGLADRISAVFVPVVLAIALLSLATWLVFGSASLGFSTALSYGLLAFVGILVIACPCALGLATPTAIIVGVGKGAEHGILVKNAESLEKLQAVTAVVFDKTGTITTGRPAVSDILPAEDRTAEEVLALAAAVERHSNHPLALAIVEKAGSKLPQAEDFKETEGSGVEATVKGKTIAIRKPTSAEQDSGDIAALQSEGKTVVLVEENRKTIGTIAISDTIKPEATKTVQALHRLGLRTVMLTGDNQRAAHYMAKQAGIDEVIAEVLPQHKAEAIAELQKKGQRVAMAGDGINDAPALTQADVGIAMATGTDIAIESSDITLLGGDIAKLPQAIRLSRATLRTVKQNLFWAFIYNVVGIPLAAGLLYPIWGIFLNPIFAGLAMGLSSVSVVSNSLLLKRKRL